MMTIRDVAREAGVSVATVSRVLNNSALVTADTRARVMKTIQRLDYRPDANAQALANRFSDTIGVVVMDVSDPFFGALVKAVDTVAQSLQKQVLIVNSWHRADKERHAIEVLIRQRCHALIVHAKALCDGELADLMQQVPGMVLVNRVVPGFAHRCVSLDNVSGALMAMRLLLQHGHQRIAYLGSIHPIEDNVQRRAGWYQALSEQGITPADGWCAEGEPDLQGGEQAMVELLGRNLQLTAVFAYNDSMAAGALAALKDNGIAVPQQLSLVGFDDIPFARYTDPQLSTVRYPIVSMAKLASELALKAAAGQINIHDHHCFMPTLVRRHSVAARQTVAAVTNTTDSPL
ncbi:HTH-type transcriptional regulator GalS [Erwinia tasmaniensis]|uniref:Mgl repressor, galactose operon inducer n=1 Tax=Erwinia tasmaniensis (strain DSM 17950 / CFBP 7177 / CIP 109463 / NCPPB 4357 / Et1/99) TaxID=465817 RepID=B2VIE7_ERWT9|nr:HTH-type transcriptional regulator GalS [Erwinia tasmaniensis]CAO96336.1 Mgl repressor, galactose operon inducer [Erwinia tasmaniensis Et1/99]